MSTSPSGVDFASHEPPVHERATGATAVELLAHLGERLDIGAVAVEEDKVTRAVIVELVGEALRDLIQQVIADGKRTGVAQQIVGRTKGQRGGNENAGVLGLDEIEQIVGRDGVHAERVVTAVLLGGTNGEDDEVVTVVEVLLYGRPGRSLNTHE